MSYQYGPETGAPKFPERITLEITTRCNLASVMCPHGLPGGMETKVDADDAIVDSLINMKSGLEYIHPTGVGEPMLAPGFWRIVDALA